MERGGDKLLNTDVGEEYGSQEEDLFGRCILPVFSFYSQAGFNNMAHITEEGGGK